MNKFVIFTFGVQCLLLKLNAFNIDCKFRIYTYDDLGKVYQCDLKNELNINSANNTKINSMTGEHLTGKNNSDVDCFYAWYKKIKFFPTGLERIFENLQGFFIASCDLVAIHQSDLKPFPKLRSVRFWENNIKVLEADLFKYNPALEYINFRRNKIIQIHPSAFNNLNKLSYLWIKYNKCISMDAEFNSTAVRQIIDKTKENCYNPDFWEIYDKFNYLESQMCSLNYSTFNDQFKSVNNSFQNSNYSEVYILKEKHEYLQQKWEERNLEISKLIGDAVANENIWKWIVISVVGFFQTIILVIIYLKIFWLA